MSIKITSMMAYIGINNDGTAKSLRGQVYKAISENPKHNRKELSLISGISINSLCARIHELLSCGAIYETEPCRCTITGRMAAPLIIMVVSKQNTTSVVRRPTIKVLEAKLAIATDALSTIADRWDDINTKTKLAAVALNKIKKGA